MEVFFFFFFLTGFRLRQKKNNKEKSERAGRAELGGLVALYVGAGHDVDATLP